MYKPNYASAPIATAAANSRLLVEGFHTVFYEEMKRATPMYEEIFDVQKSDKLSEVYTSFAGLGLAVQSADGTPTEYEDIYNGEVKEIRNYTYTKGYRVTQQTLEDDLYGITKKPMKALPKSMEYKVESTAAALVGGSFTTTYGFDPLSSTKAIISTSHAYISGKTDLTSTTAPTTWSNRLAADSAPTPTTVSDLYIIANKARDREGLPIEFGKKFILCNVNNEPVFWAIMNSVNKAFEFSNTKGIFGPSGPWNMSVKVWKWLPTQTEWYMVDPDNTPFIHQWRIKPYVTEDYAKNNFVQYINARMRYGQGAVEPRGIWGTPGA